MDFTEPRNTKQSLVRTSQDVMQLPDGYKQGGELSVNDNGKLTVGSLILNVLGKSVVIPSAETISESNFLSSKETSIWHYLYIGQDGEFYVDYIAPEYRERHFVYAHPSKELRYLGKFYYNTSKEYSLITPAESLTTGIEPDHEIFVDLSGGGSYQTVYIPESGYENLFVHFTGGTPFVDYGFIDTDGNYFTDAAGNTKVLTNLRMQGAGTLHFKGTESMPRLMPGIWDSGDFTPELEFGGGDTGMVYGTRDGKYAKDGIGKVFILINISLSNKGTSTGAAQIEGLPENVVGRAPMGIGYRGYVSITDSLYAYVTSRQVNLRELSDAGAVTFLYDTNFANNSSLWFSGEYFKW